MSCERVARYLAYDQYKNGKWLIVSLESTSTEVEGSGAHAKDIDNYTTSAAFSGRTLCAYNFVMDIGLQDHDRVLRCCRLAASITTLAMALDRDYMATCMYFILIAYISLVFTMLHLGNYSDSWLVSD